MGYGGQKIVSFVKLLKSIENVARRVFLINNQEFTFGENYLSVLSVGALGAKKMSVGVETIFGIGGNPKILIYNQKFKFGETAPCLYLSGVRGKKIERSFDPEWRQKIAERRCPCAKLPASTTLAVF